MVHIISRLMHNRNFLTTLELLFSFNNVLCQKDCSLYWERVVKKKHKTGIGEEKITQELSSNFSYHHYNFFPQAMSRTILSVAFFLIWTLFILFSMRIMTGLFFQKICSRESNFFIIFCINFYLKFYFFIRSLKFTIVENKEK